MATLVPKLTDDWFSSGYVPPPQPLEPVGLGEPLWKLTKSEHVAEARVRAIHGVGVELRYLWDGELRASQVFKMWDALEEAAAEKRVELEGRGWTAAYTNERRRGEKAATAP